jgi:elongation factor Ts
MAEISPALVKALREKTGVGMMECKKALVEADGDLDKAEEVLRKKGLSKGEKLAGRVATEGLVSSYIHTGDRIGVLVEVNCQTDFVARGDEFRQLTRDIAMQIAACPNVEYVSVDEVPAETKEREKSIEMGREDLASKPEAIREKIVLGRIEKLLKERALLEQPFIKDPNITVDELIRQKMLTIGENIKVRRFARFVLGEGLEKKEVDFAAEVAEQMKKKD